MKYKNKIRLVLLTGLVGIVVAGTSFDTSVTIEGKIVNNDVRKELIDNGSYSRYDGPSESTMKKLSDYYVPTEEPDFKYVGEGNEKTIYKSKGWNAGIMCQHYNYTIQKAHVYGVYCVLTPLIGKELLESDSMSYHEKYMLNVEYSYESHAYYDVELDSHISATLGANIGESSSMFNVEGKFEAKTSCFGHNEFGIKNIYRKNETREREYSVDLDQRALPYAPDNSSMGIGLVGSFNIYKINYYKVNETWFGESKEGDDLEVNILIANESTMAYKFVCTFGSESKKIYYYNK